MLVIKPIIPSKHLPSAAQVHDMIDKAMADEGIDTKRDFDSTTQTWSNPPEFRIGVQGITREVRTDSKIYEYVDKGTPGHDIMARHARTLAFAVGGSPKTTPGRLGSVGGSKGNVLVFTPRVHHPGTQARNFTKLIMELSQDRIRKRMEKVMDDMARGIK